MTLQVAISSECLEAFASIPKNAQSGVLNFFSKFRQNPQSSGINYEKINDAADKSYRSVRIDQNFRGIVRKPDKGNTFLLVFVAKHDVAYDWARRKKFRVNEHTGSMQIYEAVTFARNDSITQPSVKVELDNSMRISINLNDTQLLKLGVPEEYINKIHSVNSSFKLELLQKKLPVEAYEAVYLSAMGECWENLEQEYCKSSSEVIDTDDLAAALARAVSQRFFKVVEGQEELQEMLESPLEHWRVFLHPCQRKLVEKSWNGPARVLGGAGTGKTVVAMHRAKWLVQNILKEGEKLLFTTYSANLASDIRNSLAKICSNDELAKIEVKNIDKWTAEYLNKTKYPNRLLYKNHPDYNFVWSRAMRVSPRELLLSKSFYEEEWDRVIVPQEIESQETYFKAARVGRGVRLNRSQRAQIWFVFEELMVQLNRKSYRTINQAMLDASRLITRDKIISKYRAIIVDEGQDMYTEAFKMLRTLVSEQKNDLFIVGDGHQRIYSRQAIMSKCGVNIRGRGCKLKVNYRTTEQTRIFASAILQNIQVDDMDGSLDVDNDYHSLTQGENPVVELTDSFEQECDWVANQICALTANGVQLRDICLVARTRNQLAKYAAFFRRRKINVIELKQDGDALEKTAIRLATMHRVKGLEFRYVFIAGVNAGIVPLEIAINSTDDVLEKRARDLNERALIHVAATRAINQLYISCYGDPSLYLENIV
jgi:mRNA-degrading endonuclease RelE of RelBE toxin-antitoxin system